ncbi:F-box/LRR-repeat protein [Trifolium medium]|uniref:F-box/LRR-repeat protein n=1 Tax=Trifolium medium TaxID=97028 RepID=A0A392N9B5_9FABA|nr:F-box/LRR-repeat protein [Trifolium medium]
MSIPTDRISGLPDDILCHILSFIPTKQAIFTSILSKTWIHLWRHVPALYFVNKKLNSGQGIDHFNQFINAVLHSRDNSLGSRSINTFFLDFQYNISQLLHYDYGHGSSITNINNWVNHAVQRKVQYLHLYIHVRLNWEGLPPKLPASILSCATLVVLKLRFFYVDKVSPFPRFPSLKTLNLKHMYFGQSQDFMLLLDGCPVLEDLQLSHILKKVEQS